MFVFKEGGKNEFLPADDALKLQVQIQTVALDIRRKQKLLQAAVRQEASASSPPKKRSCSLLDTLLGSDSEGEDEENMDQEDGDGDSETVRKEVMSYFGENPIPRDDNPLTWWKDNAIRFPALAAVAKSYLSIPATSTPSERLFSVAGNIVSKKRASLTPKHVEMLTFLHSNI